jgi:hypothetical protein
VAWALCKGRVVVSLTTNLISSMSDDDARIGPVDDQIGVVRQHLLQ